MTPLRSPLRARRRLGQEDTPVSGFRATEHGARRGGAFDADGGAETLGGSLPPAKDFWFKRADTASDTSFVSDNGKPVVRRGRKATGPTGSAGLPNDKETVDELAHTRVSR
jgi:hypothetical protein